MAKFRYLAATTAASPFLLVYRISDNDFMTEIALPKSLLASSGECCWSPDGKYLLIARSNNIGNFLRGYRIDGPDQFVELPITNFVGITQARQVTRMCWHPSGNYVILCTTDGVCVLSVDRSTDTFTLLSSPVGGTGVDLDVSPDGSVVAMTITGSPGMRAYGFSDGALSTYVGASIPTLGSAGYGVTFSADGKWLVAGFNSPPYVKLHAVTPGKIEAAAAVPANIVNPKSMAWLKDSNVLIVATSTSPYTKTLRLVGSALTFANADNPTLSAIRDRGIRDFGDGKRILICHSVANGLTGNSAPYDVQTGLDVIARVQPLALPWAPFGLAASPEFTSNVDTTLFNAGMTRLTRATRDLTNLKFCFVSDAYAFDATKTTLADAIGATEVYGMDWPQGGIGLTNVNFVQAEGAGTDFDFTLPPTTMNTAGSMVVHGAIVYDNSDAGKTPILYLPFISAKSIGQYDQVTFSKVTGQVLTLTPE